MTSECQQDIQDRSGYSEIFVYFVAELKLLTMNILSMVQETCLCLHRFYLNQVTYDVS